MKQFLRDYFTFNKRERNGVFVLITIIIVLIIYLNVSDNFYKKEAVNFAAFEKEIAELEKQSDNSAQSPNKETTNNTVFSSKIEYFPFNPNNLPEEEWLKLGLTAKQIKTIKNYEAKGGTFRKKEDVKKIYGITNELYIKLENYITFSNTTSSVEEKKIIVEKPLAIDNTKIVDKKTTLLELNTADSSQLTTIKGIGPFFAKSIIKYRNSVGGFYKKEQLLEVWKFDQEKYDAVEKYIFTDATKIKKTNINTCEAKDLKSPYIKWNVANAIIGYRNKHGNYSTVDEIKKTDLVDEETFRKIEPYLVVE